MKRLTPFQVLDHCHDWINYRQITLPEKDRVREFPARLTRIAMAVRVLIYR